MKKVLIYMISPKHKECGKAYLESSFVIKKTSNKSSIDMGKIYYCETCETYSFKGSDSILYGKHLKDEEFETSEKVKRFMEKHKFNFIGELEKIMQE